MIMRSNGENVVLRALTAGTAATQPLGFLGTGAPSPVADVAPRNAMQSVDVFACVKVLADSAASLPLIPYRRMPDGSRRRHSGGIADLLRTPAPGVTQADLISGVVAHLNLWGNAFIGKYRDADGSPVSALRLLHPDRVRVEMIDGEPRYTWVDFRGQTFTRMTRADVCHIRGLGTDGLLGLSPIRQNVMHLGLGKRLTQHAVNFFEQGGVPVDGVVSFETSPSKLQRDEFRDEWQARYSRARRGIGLIWGGATYQPPPPMEDLQFVEQRKLSTIEICRIFGVPPSRIGAPTGEKGLTYSTVEQHQQEFIDNALRPWLVRIEQALTIDPDLSPTTVYVEFLLDALLRGDSKTRADIYTLALAPDTGWMTRDEVRLRENLDPDPVGGITA